MEHRNRSTGWQHAKLSGHSNESLAKELLESDYNYASIFLARLGLESERIHSISIGGLHEQSVPSVYGRKTKSKTDLKINCNSGNTINISIKKSLGGQVYFVRANLFIEVFERQFHKTVPIDVQEAIKLFWAASDDAITIIQQYGDRTNSKSFDLQMRHKSLNATTLKNYDETLYYSMLQWFKDNIYELTKLSFAMGAVQDKNEWSDYIWYINLLDEHNIDAVFNIEDICQAAVNYADSEIYYGTSNGGTTIQLPFGFVQWHQKQLQFHHSYDKICNLIR